MGLTAARSQMQEQVYRGQRVAIAEDVIPVMLEYKCGLPISIYNFVARSEMQEIRRSRMNQRGASSFQHNTWSD